jgi:signal transduction histidine kinase
MHRSPMQIARMQQAVEHQAGRHGSFHGGDMDPTHQGAWESDGADSGATSWRDGLTGFAAGLVHRRRRTISQGELIASLNEVAAAVSSAVSVEEALNAIVERARRLTDTDKAAIVLADEHDGSLDLDTIVVRGRRDQHPQEWWQIRLDSLGERLWASSDSAVEYHAEQAAWLLWSPICVKDHPVGVLCAINTADRPFTDLHVDFLAVLSAFAGSSIENARLAEQSRYMLLASERDRIAREMHDGVVQSLFSISLGLELCKKRIDRDPHGVILRLDELQTHLNSSMAELRRFIYDLRSAKLTELGLVGAIDYWINDVTRGRDVRGQLVVSGTLPSLTPWQEACLYRVAKESVSNIIKHAGASHFEVQLAGSDDQVTLIIADDGCGFDAIAAVNGGGVGIGLQSIRERVSRADGTLRVESTPGRGTTITVVLTPGGRYGHDQRPDS